MRKVAILIVVLAGVVFGSYFLFFKSSAPSQLVNEQPKKPTDKPKPSPKKPSPVFEPSKFHPLKHYNGPKNRYADDYFKNENLREELHDDREELADTIRKYDRYNHYDYHDEYQDAYDNYYYDDDYFYHDYYDYMYPQFNDSEWEHLNSIYSDSDVNDYLKEERQAKKLEKENENSGTKMSLPVAKAKAAQAKLASPVVKKEQGLKKQFVDNKKTTISKIAPNTKRTLDLFLAQKEPDKKFDIFGTHAREPFEKALPEALQKKVFAQEILITDESNKVVLAHFEGLEDREADEADEGKKGENQIRIIRFERDKLESEIAHHAGKNIVVVIESSSLFGDEGLLSHLLKDGYTLYRYQKDSTLEKYESAGQS